MLYLHIYSMFLYSPFNLSVKYVSAFSVYMHIYTADETETERDTYIFMYVSGLLYSMYSMGDIVSVVSIQ
jgi:hypothetical protein